MGDDEIDDVMGQLMEDQAQKDAQKSKKRKRPPTKQAETKKEDPIVAKKPTMFCDWRSSRPGISYEPEPPEEEAQPQKEEKEEEPPKDDDLGSQVDKAFSALRGRLGDFQTGVGAIDQKNV